MPLNFYVMQQAHTAFAWEDRGSRKVPATWIPVWT